MNRVLASLLICLLATGADGCAKKKPTNPPPPPSVGVAHPYQEQIVDWDDYVGRFEAVDSVDVRPRVSGYLQSVGFRDGAVVRKGQVLFVIDPRPYQAALDQARGQTARAVATLNNAQVELRRAQALVQALAASQQELETRRATAQQAQADLAAAQAGERIAALNLSFTRVTAPMSGRISDRRVAPGNLVSQDSTVLTTIVNLDPIRFTFQGPEADYLKHQRLVGQSGRSASTPAALPVEIKLQDETAYRWRGRLDFVDNQMDVNSGTIRGRAVVANPSYLLTPGMFGHMRLQGSRAYSGMLLPDAAVTTDQDRQLVYVLDANNVVHEQVVTAGPIIDGLRVIRGGLNPNMRVVIDGASRAKPGKKVTPKAARVQPAQQASSGPGYTSTPSAAATTAGEAQ